MMVMVMIIMMTLHASIHMDKSEACDPSPVTVYRTWSTVLMPYLPGDAAFECRITTRLELSYDMPSWAKRCESIYTHQNWTFTLGANHEKKQIVVVA